MQTLNHLKNGAKALYSQVSSSQQTYWNQLDPDEGLEPFSSQRTNEPEDSPDPTSAGTSRQSSTRSLETAENANTAEKEKRKAEDDPISLNSRKRQRTTLLPVPHVLDGLRLVDLTPTFQGQVNYVAKLPWAVRWEMARLEQNGVTVEKKGDISWIHAQQGKPIAEILGSLRAITPGQLRLSDAERRQREPWSELDDEAKARGHTYGFDTPTAGSALPDRTYGKVHFNARLKVSQVSEHRISVLLEPPELDTSTRLSRVFGSDSIIRLSLKDKDVNFGSQSMKGYPSGSDIRDYFVGSIFRLFNRDFQVLLLKDQVAVLVEVRKDLTLWDIINWHNPPYLNKEQPVAKWVSRFRLVLSDTEAALSIDNKKIKIIHDFDGKRQMRREDKIPTNQNMTDGCGFANAELLLEVQKLFQWQSFPAALQIRYAGAKGMVLLDAGGRYKMTRSEPMIALRASQCKIKLPEPTLSQQILEVVMPTKLGTPFRLSAETILNLAHNGVPSKIFEELSEVAMEETFKSLTNWGVPYAMQHLYHNVYNGGGILNMRLKRTFSGGTRAYGFSGRDNRDDEDFEPEELDEISTAWFPDPISGCPSTLEETALTMLLAGFHPATNNILAEKLGKVLEKRFKSSVEGFRLSIPMSANVHFPEEFMRLLGDHEIHLLCSEQRLVTPHGRSDRIIGEALISRYPCKAPGDFQKVKVIAHPELCSYTDICLMPIMGSRSLASMLGGGDYDGDTIVIVWDPDIVNSFKPGVNYEESSDNPELFFKQEDNFHKDTKTVAQILEHYPEAEDLTPADKHRLARELQEALLEGLIIPNLIGKYSVRHDQSIAKNGYGHPETIRLANMFCTVLDAAKSGLRIFEEVGRKDAQAWDPFMKPLWRQAIDEAKGKSGGDGSEQNAKYLCGSNNGPKSVLDCIYGKAVKKRKDLLERYSTLISADHARMYDKHLAAPWEIEVTRISNLRPILRMAFTAGLEAIKTHVQRQRRETATSFSTFTKLPIRERQDILRAESLKFTDVNNENLKEAVDCYEPDTLKRLMASYAYIHDTSEGKRMGTRWPWNVAMRELCGIKAKALGGFGEEHVCGDMAQLLQISKKGLTGLPA